MIKTISAFILVTVKFGKERDVLESIRTSAKDNIEETLLTYGEYDVLVKLKIDSISNLNEPILTKLRDIPEIVSTNTLIQV